MTLLSQLCRDPPRVWAALRSFPCSALGWEELGIAQVCDHFHEHPLKVCGFWKPQQDLTVTSFLLDHEGWMGPSLLPSWPCTLSTTIIPLAPCAPGAHSPLLPVSQSCLDFLQEPAASAQARQLCSALCSPVPGWAGA